jgi:ATP-dependent DNA helicase RecG
VKLTYGGGGVSTPPKGSYRHSAVLSNEKRGVTRALDDDLQYLKGVGPSVAQILAKMNLHTVSDLLRYVPRRYEDRTHFRRLSEVMPGELATLHGRVIAADTQGTSRKNFQITKVLIDDGSGVGQLIFFQQPYLQKRFQEMARAGRWIVVYGQAKRSGYGPVEIERAEWEEVSDDTDALSTHRIVPVYPATEGITQKRLRRIIYSAINSYESLIEEPLPPAVLLQHHLLDRKTSIRNVHFPESAVMMEAARRRLIFEEFFLLQVGLARRRKIHAHAARAHRIAVDVERLREVLRKICSFELTGAQWRAIEDIAQDISSGRVMNRLIQGDVGSGKTMVAVAAMLMAVEAGLQAALMAPTEILAQQHAIVLKRLLEPLKIPIELAIGSLRSKEKEAARTSIASGESRIVIGTHALIQEGVEFHKLGLAVIDEQHRFGVLQRQALQKKGEQPHVLVMTATPIPRTLTLTVYGDLDTSIIHELPPGRKPIKTHWKRSEQASEVYSAMQRLILQGRQAYIVCPLVEESEKLQVKAATKLAEHIQRDVFPQFRVGLLHGQMRTEEKEEMMRQFKAQELDILVATTVIEVGIDVPNATVIVIEDADRFGLAQLHQLRGRVGRGEHPSYCILMASPKTEDAITRMQVMTETQDGFRIAEEDLKLRGPGEIFGTRQSGLPEFYIGDIVRDVQIMDEARRTAFQLIETDPNLSLPEHRLLHRELQRSRVGYELIHVS